MKAYEVIINNEVVETTKTLKQAFEIAQVLNATNYEWDDVKEQYQEDKENYKEEVQDWKDEGKLDGKPVFDFVFWLKPYDENTTHDRIKEVQIDNIPQQEQTKAQAKVKFSVVWVIIHIILAICSGGITIVAYTLPWVIAKYQTKDNVSGLGILVFSWLYNIYRLTK